MTIKIDVDGVIRDMMTPMCELYNNLNADKTVKKTPDNVKYYDVAKSFPMFGIMDSSKIKEWFFQRHSREVFLLAKPFPYAKESIDKLRSKGHKIVIVTYQESYENKIHTLEFLNNYGIKYDDICFTKDKESIYGDMLVDDNPDFLEKQEGNTIKVCVDRPYNEDYTNCHIKINDLRELVNIVNRMSDDIFVSSVISKE